MNRWGWNLFWSLAALNAFAVAGYQWSLASSDPSQSFHRLVDAFEINVPLTPDERKLLEDLENRVLAKRQELLPHMEQLAPPIRELLLEKDFNEAELLSLMQQNFPRRLEYMRYEHAELHQVLQQLPEAKRKPLVDFLIEHRLNAIRRWVDQSAH
jgi:hypothetical protein